MTRNRPPRGGASPWLGLLLALWVGLAAPAAGFVWLHGAHATPEQAELHAAAVGRGHLHHHRAEASARPPSGPTCPHDAPANVAVPDGPDLRPGSAGAMSPSDASQGCVILHAGAARAETAERLGLHASAGAGQQVPRPPVPPPNVFL